MFIRKLIFIATTCITPALAQEPSNEAIDRFMEVSGMDGSIQVLKQTCPDSLKRMAPEDNIWSNPIIEGIPKHSVYGSKVRQAYDALLREYCDTEKIEAFRNIARATLRGQLSSEELQKSTDYYSSDTGRKVNALLSNISMNMMNSYARGAPQRLQTSLQHFDEQLRAIRDEYRAASK